MSINNKNEINHSDSFIFSKHPGLKTKDALDNLYYEILKFKNDICKKNKKNDFHCKILRSSFHHLSYYSTLSWIPICILFLISASLIIFTSSGFSVIAIFLLTSLNIIVVYWNNYLRFNELKNRIEYVLKTLKKVKKKNNWRLEQFPNLYTPHSPSVSLQWTIRDGQLVNLPSILLVKGDIIIMKPGQLSPADVETVHPPPSPDNKYNFLVTDQLFACEPTTCTTKIAQSEVHRIVERPPVENRLYEVTKAPYIAQLNSITDKYLERPISLYDKARYLLFGKCLHHVILPSCLVLCEILAVVRWYVFPHLHCKSCTQYERWAYFFLVETSSFLIPIISLVFPLFWFISNAIGNTLLLSRYSLLENEEDKLSKQLKECRKSESSFFDDLESSLKSFTDSTNNYKVRVRNNFWHLFMNFIQNSGVIVVRCTNFLHTMASITVLCCVDKKGVLSFPNPIAEKVFFLKNISNPESHLTKNGEISNAGSRTIACNKEDSNNDGDMRKVTEDSQIKKSSKRITTAVEILDITPRDDKGSAWKIEFDDSRWRCHLSSLKPLGLAILLNTCNKNTHKTYHHFCAHITSHALQNKHLVPVANRRCLCELARQIGFHERIVEDKYNLELQLFTYKNLAEKQVGNKYVKALFKTRKPKFPFPHAMSVIVNNNNCKNNNARSNTMWKEKKEEEKKRKRSSNDHEEKHMFSQGTADVILDFCVDYWDGYDVHPLTPAIRKKILDFYQRSNLTAYCTAFSYRPVYKNLRKTSTMSISSTVYVELLKNMESQSRQRHRKRRHLRRHDAKINVRNNQTQQLRNENTSVSNFSYNSKSYYKSEHEFTPLQDVTECDEEIDDNFGENIDEYDENIDYSIDECEDDMEYNEYSEDSDDEEENFHETSVDGEYKSTNMNDQKLEKKHIQQNYKSPDDYFYILGKQIFLGMVSMQYQPLVDMVQMIEELEKACIRFVHFSKENELRSRVFSEKMGLESGWNCHISLLPDIDKNQFPEVFGNEAISLTVTEHDISSTVETGASSADDEENVPFAFDMSNRAKLPCGINNIKPHLEQVDNVPLLVSLFTDCTSDTTEQMLAIMQEYGQIVCVLGSSANIKNFSLFAQADASISVEPMYAQVCQQIPSSPFSEKYEGKCLSPTELSHLLNSLPCSLFLQRNYNYSRILPICPLIAESRNVMRLVWNCCQFWLCCIALTMTVQLLALLLLLPAIFTLEQALWISIIMTPCLSVSLATAFYDDDIMTKAKGKDWLCSINWTTIKDAMLCYGTKLMCGIIAILISYIIELMTVCDCLSKYYNSYKIISTNETASKTASGKTHCVYVFFLADFHDDVMESEYINTLSIIQTHMALILSLNLVTLCVSFLHRDSVFWKKIPRFNSVWLIFVLLPLSIQIIHFVVIINYWSTDCLINNISLLSVRSSVLTFFSPCLTYFISEIIKIHEIRINERYQKKVRLEFGTKLGMNSPF